ncbi:hypothetical protein [Taibaiella soli]|uniref:hypothetical protein n=1 Tax=Taibaiella soli TaxID=1649169 RepID=UPI001A9E5BCB|nr:hypothetical protein [Taibaiella soli]
MKRLPGMRLLGLILAAILIFGNERVAGQQFNSDSWLSKPCGMVTLIPTLGQRNSMLMTTFSLFPRWEFTVAGYMYNNDGDPRTDDGYSTSLYAKYMFYENKSQTGGAAVKVGTGMRPGTISGEDRTKDAFKTYWMNVPCTIPFFNNKLSLDLMPGASVTRNFGGKDQDDAWGFTYSTRVAWYPFNMEWAAVGEIFGTTGEAGTLPEYKAGIRWEPSQHAVFAFTYGNEFKGTNGAGFEFGIMLFSPPFVCLKGIKLGKLTSPIKKTHPPKKEEDEDTDE